MKKLNSKGVGLIELVIILLIVGLIAGIGFYVWNNKLKTDKLNAISSFAECKANSGSKIQETFPEVCVAKNGKSFTNPDQKVEKNKSNDGAENSVKYLEIKELGIKMELNAATNDAYYIMNNGYAYISLMSLKNADAECGADKTGVVAIGKYKKTDIDEMSGKTYGELAATSGKVIGNDAYYLNRSQAYCSDDNTLKQKQQTAWDGFQAQAATIQPL